MMKMTRKGKQPTMLKVAHDIAKDLYEEDVVDAITMREIDALCLAPVKELSLSQPACIRKILKHKHFYY